MADIAKKAKVAPDKPVLAGLSRLAGFLWSAAWEQADDTIAGDAQALHDMRVALRRLRSCLQNFEGSKSTPLLSSTLREEFKSHRTAVGKLGDALGAVRDHDVLDEYLRSYLQTQQKIKVPEINANEFPGLHHFEQFLIRERNTAFAPMQKRIAKARRPGGLQENFARWALGLPAAFAPETSLRETAHQLLTSRVNEVLGLAATLDDSTDELEHHEFRKALRRVRYTLETLGPCFDWGDDEIKTRLKTLVSLQDVLGEMQDRSVLHEKVLQAFEIKAGKKSRELSKLPPDAVAFLQYGKNRKRHLLGKARAQWRKIQTDESHFLHASKSAPSANEASY